MESKQLLDDALQLKSIADIGLLYGTNDYDRERYTAIREISFRMIKSLSGAAADQLLPFFLPATDYPTAKVDLRALILSAENKILLTRESADGRWSLPGGWADIGASPRENIIKECREETGLDVVPERLLAVFDKAKHHHPPQAEYVYKMVFFCRPVSNTLQAGFDVLDVRYFALDDLPELSENRILKSQIELVCQLAMDKKAQPYFD